MMNLNPIPRDHHSEGLSSFDIREAQSVNASTRGYQKAMTTTRRCPAGRR